LAKFPAQRESAGNFSRNRLSQEFGREIPLMIQELANKFPSRPSREFSRGTGNFGDRRFSPEYPASSPQIGFNSCKAYDLEFPCSRRYFARTREEKGGSIDVRPLGYLRGAAKPVLNRTVNIGAVT
jgi:hypothetical protein